MKSYRKRKLIKEEIHPITTKLEENEGVLLEKVKKLGKIL